MFVKVFFTYKASYRIKFSLTYESWHREDLRVEAQDLCTPERNELYHASA